MLPNAKRVEVSVGGLSAGEEESLTAEIARVEAVLAERRYELTSNRAAVRVVGRTLARAAHAAARALLGAAERPARTAADARRPRRRSAP
jgi:hypothetical protein